MTNPKNDTEKTITELKEIAGGATGPTIDTGFPPQPYNPYEPARSIDVAKP